MNGDHVDDISKEMNSTHLSDDDKKIDKLSEEKDNVLQQRTDTSNDVGNSENCKSFEKKDETEPMSKLQAKLLNMASGQRTKSKSRSTSKESSSKSSSVSRSRSR